VNSLVQTNLEIKT